MKPIAYDFEIPLTKIEKRLYVTARAKACGQNTTK